MGGYGWLVAVGEPGGVVALRPFMRMSLSFDVVAVMLGTDAIRRLSKQVRRVCPPKLPSYQTYAKIKQGFIMLLVLLYGGFLLSYTARAPNKIR